MFITCTDLRIVLELITHSSPGDLFVTRNVGNVVPPYGQMNGSVSTAIEYAVLTLDVQHIIVCGHSNCSAMRMVLYPDSLENMSTVRAWLRHADVAKSIVKDNFDFANESASMQALTEENVIAQLQHLRTHPSVALRMASGYLFIHGWIYNIETSDISAYDVDLATFRLLNDIDTIPCATPRVSF
ncbi:Carbonic anhydrase 1 [Candidatus Pseudomonas adelgestsugas]|uniref:carbonic anhydrase n=1 Tax=Candidatus Pseudomonas adelgestsugas TaxID=1302376 RepID=A0ABX5R9R0_9PSED|nr:Carbonic anhydrase 1 [Candidatus Pseudomonas adelgestsugas]